MDNLDEMYTDTAYIKALNDIEKSHSSAFKVKRYFRQKWQPVQYWLSQKFSFIEEPVPF